MLALASLVSPVSPARPLSSVSRWGWGVAFGVAGYALNLAALPLAFGLDFILGGTLAILALRLFGAGPGILAAAISSAATYVLWHHPYAAIVFTLEVAFLAVLIRWRNVPPLLAAAIYWVILGGPLLFLTYGGILGMDTAAVALVAAKQGINSLVHIILAEIIVLAGVMAFPALAARLALRRISLANLMFIGFVAFAAIPAITIAVVDARQRFDDVVVKAGQQARNLSAHGQSILTRHVNDIVAETVDIMESGGDPSLLALHHDLTYLKVTDVISGVAVESANSRNENPADFLLLNNVSADIRGKRVVISARKQLAQVQRILDFAAFVPGENLNIRPASGLPASGTSEIRSLGGGAWLHLPALAGKSIMQSWSAATVEASLPGLDGRYEFHVNIPLDSRIADYRSDTLYALGVVLVLMLLLPLFALPVSRAFVSGLETVIENMRRYGPSEQIAPAVAGARSPLAEVAMLGTEFEKLTVEISRRRLETERHRSRLEHLIHDAPVVILVLSKEERNTPDRMRVVSDSASRILGYSPEEIRAPGWFQNNLHPDDAEAVDRQRGVMQETGKASHRFRFRHRDGHYLTIFSETQVMTEPTTGEQEVMIVWLDQTQQAAAERKVVQSAKMADLGQMATGMAHELNQPLNIIDLAAANTIGRIDRGKADDDYVRSKLDRIRAQVSRATEIIDHMRIFGRADSGEQGPFLVRKVVDGLETLYRKQVTLDGIDFEIDNAVPDARVLGNPGLLEQVLLNLVTNARQQIKARMADGHDAPAAGGRHFIRIAVRDRRGGAGIELSVADSGGGVDPSILPRIFDPFVTSKPVGQGTGLGLSVAYGIVHDMGGRIEALSEADGATFTVSLPLAEPVAA
jgi:PAS domain S-box-containing protein